MFWANHFAVAVGKGPGVRILAGAFEREAIRPHVFGRFEDMLLAVETHPAMLFFLDNQQSVGPDSKASNHGKRGLNENLAREIMELHTLGVDAGYTQRDVTSLSRIITGWTVVGAEGRLGAPGTFAFNRAAHEPGSQALLGVSIRAMVSIKAAPPCATSPTTLQLRDTSPSSSPGILSPMPHRPI